jgi:hypothetical protein
LRFVGEASSVAESSSWASDGRASCVGAVVTLGTNVTSDTIGGSEEGSLGSAVVTLEAFVSRIDESLGKTWTVVARSAVGAARLGNQASLVGPSTDGARILGSERSSSGAVVPFDTQFRLSVVGGGTQVLGVAEVTRRANLADGELRSIGVIASSAAKLSGSSVGAVVADVAHAESRVGNDLARRTVETTPASRTRSSHCVCWAVATTNTRLASED